MDEKKKSEYIGKYVCYDRIDGGACWGRIKDEAKVNTIHGEKEVFILCDRWVRYSSCKNKGDFRTFFPDLDNLRNRQTMVMSKDGMVAPEYGDIFFEVSRVNGDSTLRKEMIDLEKDVIDAEELIRRAGVEVVFRAVLAARGSDFKSAAEMGVNALLSSEDFKRLVSKVFDGVSGDNAEKDGQGKAMKEGGGDD